LKLDRARTHLGTLDVSLNTIYPSSGPRIPLIAGFDLDDASWVVRTGDFRPPGITVASTHIGDIVHNLRGALDHLVWDLAILDGGAWPVDALGREIETQFPICGGSDGQRRFRSKTVQSVRLHSLTPEHRAVIERFQPYVAGDDALTRLATISNADKHRAVQPVFIVSQSAQPYIRGSRECEVVGGNGSRPILQSGLEPNSEILRLPLRNIGPDPHVDVLVEVAIGVGFEDRAPVTGTTLMRVADVVEEILAAFEPELTAPEALRTREAADRNHQP